MSEKETAKICVDIPREDYIMIQDFNKNNPRPVSLRTIGLVAMKNAIEEVRKERNTIIK